MAAEIFRLENDRWTIVASHAADEVVRVEPFPDAELQLRRWWLPA